MRRELTVKKAKKMGVVAAASGIGTLALTALFASFTWWLGVIVFLAGSAFTYMKTRDWLLFRGEWGIRF